MNTRIISKLGNFTVHIVSYWDSTLHADRWKIQETGEVYPSQEKAIKRAKMILKKKRDRYCEKYHIVKRMRTKTKIVENVKNDDRSNVWHQIHIV